MDKEINNLLTLENIEKKQLNKFNTQYRNKVTDDHDDHDDNDWYMDISESERKNREVLLRWVELHRKQTRQVPILTIKFTPARMRTMVENHIKQMYPQATIACGLAIKLQELLQEHVPCIGFALDAEVLILKNKSYWVDDALQDHIVLKLWEFIIHPENPLGPYVSQEPYETEDEQDSEDEAGDYGVLYNDDDGDDDAYILGSDEVGEDESTWL